MRSPTLCGPRSLQSCHQVLRPTLPLSKHHSSLLQLPRAFSHTSPVHTSRSPPSDAVPLPLPPRWLSDLKIRLGKCIMFGMPDPLAAQAGQLLFDLAQNWRSYLAGSEGFLIDPRRAGLTRHPIVWGEQDTMGHVNNVQYIRYAESGRTNWTRQIGVHFDRTRKTEWSDMLTSRSYGLILKRIEVDFKFPMTWPDRISVFHKLRHMPSRTDSSMLLDVLILSEGKQRPAARCVEDVVVYDYNASRKSVCPEWMLRQFQIQFDEQEEAKRFNTAKVKAILDQVRWLEQQTWDRIDAKEDMGSAE